MQGFLFSRPVTAEHFEQLLMLESIAGRARPPRSGGRRSGDRADRRLTRHDPPDEGGSWALQADPREAGFQPGAVSGLLHLHVGDGLAAGTDLRPRTVDDLAHVVHLLRGDVQARRSAPSAGWVLDRASGDAGSSDGGPERAEVVAGAVQHVGPPFVASTGAGAGCMSRILLGGPAHDVANELRRRARPAPWPSGSRPCRRGSARWRRGRRTPSGACSAPRGWRPRRAGRPRWRWRPRAAARPRPPPGPSAPTADPRTPRRTRRGGGRSPARPPRRRSSRRRS